MVLQRAEEKFARMAQKPSIPSGGIADNSLCEKMCEISSTRKSQSSRC